MVDLEKQDDNRFPEIRRRPDGTYEKGQCGNTGGRPKGSRKKPILDALEELLDKRPGLAMALAKRYLVMSTHDSGAMREVWARLEGRIVEGEKRELPSMSVVIQQMAQRPIVELNGHKQSTNGHVIKPLVVEVEATSVDVSDDEEEDDDES